MEYTEETIKLTLEAIKTACESQYQIIIDSKIEFPDDIYNRRLELAVNERDKLNVINSYDFLKDINGTIVLPDNLRDRPYVLINQNQLNQNCDFMHTGHHELIHIYDYYIYAKYYNIQDLTQIDSSQYGCLYYFWTEFNARRIATICYRNKLYASLKFNKEDIEQNIISEIPIITRELIDELLKPEKKYHIVQYIARLMAYNDMFLEYKFNIPEELISIYPTQLNILYDFLLHNKEFEQIVDNFEAFEEIINLL